MLFEMAGFEGKSMGQIIWPLLLNEPFISTASRILLNPTKGLPLLPFQWDQLGVSKCSRPAVPKHFLVMEAFRRHFPPPCGTRGYKINKHKTPHCQNTISLSLWIPLKFFLSFSAIHPFRGHFPTEYLQTQIPSSPYSPPYVPGQLLPLFFQHLLFSGSSRHS